MRKRSKCLSPGSLLVVATLVCLACAAFAVSAQTDENERWATGKYEAWYLNYKRYSKTDVLAAQEKWKRLDADEDAGEWAGDYTPLCDFCEVSLDKLRWSPKSGFLEIHVYTCLPELRGLNFGNAVESVTDVHLIPEYPSASGRSLQPARQYLKVKWGERHYLINENEIAEFCRHIAGLDIRRENEPLVAGDFYLKDSDWDKPATGWPVLPKGYKHLLKRPIDAKITAVGRGYVEYDYENGCSKQTIIPVTLDAGSASGVKVGTIFKFSTEEGPIEFTVTSVSKDSARAITEGFGWQLCEESEEAREEQAADEENRKAKIKVGLQLSTRVTP
jgi:hypothetical protein